MLFTFISSRAGFSVKGTLPFRQCCNSCERTGGRVLGEKDITEKTLEDYADVFADIVNVLLMMKAVTGDHRYEEVRKTVRKGERITMCEVLDYREERGEKRGIQRGMQRGIQRGIERDRRALNKLNDLLLEDGRIEDLKRSTKDSDFQQKLLDEYGLTV